MYCILVNPLLNTLHRMCLPPVLEVKGFGSQPLLTITSEAHRILGTYSTQMLKSLVLENNSGTITTTFALYHYTTTNCFPEKSGPGGSM